MKRAKGESKRTQRPESTQRLYTPERVRKVSWLARQLWSELRGWLRVLETELTWLGGGGEAPVQACRTRVRMMQGAMQSLAGDMRRLCFEPGDHLEAWHWLDEFRRPVEGWLTQLGNDLKDTGTTPAGEDLRDDTWFTPEYAIALGSLQEAYREWWFVAWSLASIEAPVTADEVARFDERLKFVEVRLRARRVALRAMPERDMSWAAS
jgi:hypothetical protein